jgi:hypothetical protein
MIPESNRSPLGTAASLALYVAFQHPSKRVFVPSRRKTCYSIGKVPSSAFKATRHQGYDQLTALLEHSHNNWWNTATTTGEVTCVHRGAQ